MSDYKDLSKKLLENRKISVYDYYKEIVAKNNYMFRYNELFKENIELDKVNTYLICFLVVSFSLNVSFLIVMCFG